MSGKILRACETIGAGTWREAGNAETSSTDAFEAWKPNIRFGNVQITIDNWTGDTNAFTIKVIKWEQILAMSGDFLTKDANFAILVNDGDDVVSDLKWATVTASLQFWNKVEASDHVWLNLLKTKNLRVQACDT